ncbi:uncharacterized protein LOC109857624 [Pseudomyrmex gracilis]|uniref:uncharacterized protein LOC109857624 n=1 Tax=Pseudomyrmex gracilis TaxID=219809 RepID=UPI00099563AC|nr:uncharacterized protein LOC109857624 [Pseudomyrmex gracilis]
MNYKRPSKQFGCRMSRFCRQSPAKFVDKIHIYVGLVWFGEIRELQRRTLRSDADSSDTGEQQENGEREAMQAQAQLEAIMAYIREHSVQPEGTSECTTIDHYDPWWENKED